MKGIRNQNILRRCKNCEIEFHPLRSSLSQGTGYFCSIGCSSSFNNKGKNNGRYNGGEVQLTCVICGKDFYIPRAWIKKNRKYCSTQCMGIGRKGSNNVSYKDGRFLNSDKHRIHQREWSKQVRKRDKNYCQFCESKENLHAHHIKNYHDFIEDRYDVDNGITLCNKCHGWVHSKEQYFELYFNSLNEPSETTRSTLLNGEDIVRTIQKCIEQDRNDLADYNM